MHRRQNSALQNRVLSGILKHIFERRAQNERAWLCANLQQQRGVENMQ